MRVAMMLAACLVACGGSGFEMEPLDDGGSTSLSGNSGSPQVGYDASSGGRADAGVDEATDATDATPIDQVDVWPICSADEHLCDDACVPNDPEHGCGQSCDPCTDRHGVGTCVNGGCSITCDLGCDLEGGKCVCQKPECCVPHECGALLVCYSGKCGDSVCDPVLCNQFCATCFVSRRGTCVGTNNCECD